MKGPQAEAAEDEADRFADTPHPRHALTLIGQADRERELLDAYRNNRLPHAIIIGGPPGIGKATLAWRLARFLVANPIAATAAVRDATDLEVPAGTRAYGQIASLAHPDVALLRREMNAKTKRLFTEIRADDVRRVIGLFQRGAGAGGYRIAIVDSAEDLNRSSANALLKLIEEPPPLSLFLLVAHRPGLILPTIRSRARLIRLAPPTATDAAAVIAGLGPPWTDLPAAEIAAAAASGGSLHGALRRLGRGGGDVEAAVLTLLDRLPAVDWRQVHRLADQVAGRDGDVAIDTVLAAVFEWLGVRVRAGAGQGPPRRLAPLAEVWEKVAASARETEALNLDRRALILSVFSDLAAAARVASS